MASSSKQKHPTTKDKDSIITVKQETGDSIITIKQQHQTTIITVKQEHQTGDSVITLKHQHQTGDYSIITTIKHEHETGDSFITVKKQQRPTGEDKDSFINVKIKTPMGRVDDFRVKRDEPLHRLMKKWSVRLGVPDYDLVNLFFDGRIINGDRNKTANDIGLKDGDCITVVAIDYES